MSLPRKYMVEKRVCGTCVHYRQHYVRTEQGNYYPLWYGHCIHPWRRHPEPDFGCERWEEQKTGRSRSAKADRLPDIQVNQWQSGGSQEPRGRPWAGSAPECRCCKRR